jgi:hypothetical protein
LDERLGLGALKVKHHLRKLFPRVGFIVTTLTGTSRTVVRFYNQRGAAEQWIKEGTEATHWTRLVLPLATQRWSLTSLQQRLFKTGGPLIRRAR